MLSLMLISKVSWVVSADSVQEKKAGFGSVTSLTVLLCTFGKEVKKLLSSLVITKDSWDF